MRPYREYVALKTIQDLNNVTYLIHTNIPDSEHDTVERQKNDQLKENGKLWIIMKLLKGCTLEKYIEPKEQPKRIIPIRDAVGFSIRLLKIIKSFHERGVVHRDVKPDNIQVEWTSGNKSLFESNITILDFGQAFIQINDQQIDNADFDKEEVPTYPSALYIALGNHFYRVPQLCTPKTPKNIYEEKRLIQLRRSPTIDASSVCAILFWLITGIAPIEEYIKNNSYMPPHYTAESKEAISKAILQARDETGKMIFLSKNTL
ncbi:unnamed protein product [Adineta steineri]|nr:unnamed protein product [Adineta steineri]